MATALVLSGGNGARMDSTRKHDFFRDKTERALERV